MYPDLFSIGPFTLHAFGAMVALGFIGAWWFLRVDLAERGYDPEAAFWCIVGAAVGGLVGAKVWYAIDNGGGLVSGSGLTWYGGLIGGALCALGAGVAQRIPLGQLANAAAAPLALGYAVGRIGCQLAGDGDYGSPSKLPWAMSYPDGTVPTTQTVHPTPVYETLAMMVVFWALWRLRGRLGRPWELFGLYAVLAGTERFLVEFIRRNPDTVGALTTAQVFSAGLVLAGVVILLLVRRVRVPTTG
ncbi:MAG: prolipoprotein diacylglyceryl transferase family protein [Thermoleophilia bacterium]